MPETTFTQEQFDALNKAIAQGTLVVEYGDKKVTYRSLTEMLRIRNLIGTELGLISTGGGRKVAAFSKDWGCRG